jgi:hypothetical protein
LIAEEYRRHDYLLDSDVLKTEEEETYRGITKGNAKYSDYCDALKNLSAHLEAYHKEKTIVLIDEYDVPINAGFLHGYYDDVVDFLRAFLSEGLKTNEHLWRAVLTGCMRVAKESIFTGLNNLDVLSILKNECSEYFGFTQKEVELMAEYYEIEDRLPVIKQWYDGYLFGNSEVYNPWSIINYVRDNPDFPAPYWANTSGNELVKQLISKGDGELKSELLDLMEGKEIEKYVNDNVVFPDLGKSSEHVWNFLLFSGYLRLGQSRFEQRKKLYKLTIPNEEVMLIYDDIILDWTTEGLHGRDFDNMLLALLTGQDEYFSDMLNKYLINSLSYFDTAESFYHGMFIGMAMRLASKYDARSNRESGLGRFDIMLVPKNPTDNGVVIEFKIPTSRESIENAAEKALDQIEKKKYEQELISAGCAQVYKYGIAIKDKEAFVLMG